MLTLTLGRKNWHNFPKITGHLLVELRIMKYSGLVLFCLINFLFTHIQTDERIDVHKRDRRAGGPPRVTFSTFIFGVPCFKI